LIIPKFLININKRFKDGKPLDFITKFGYENDMNNLVQSQEAHKTLLANSPEEIGGIPTASEGIYIKPSKRGSFTAWAKRHDMGVQEAAKHVMANKDEYGSAIVKKANFAKNFAHGIGGQLDNIEFKRGGSLPKYDEISTDSSFLLGNSQDKDLNLSPTNALPIGNLIFDNSKNY